MANLADNSGDAYSNLVQGTGTSSATFTMPGAVPLAVESVVATINNTAGGVVTPLLTIRDSGGEVIFRGAQRSTIPAGESDGVATWALRLDDSYTATTTSSGVIYDYEVAGAAQHTIDTAVDGAMAGAFPTSFYGLSMFFCLRDDAGVTTDPVDLVLNNDVASNYYREAVQAGGGGAIPSSGYSSLTPYSFPCIGDAAPVTAFSMHEMVCYNYASTVTGKQLIFTASIMQHLAANSAWQAQAFYFDSTAALTRFKIEPTNPAVKFKVGSRVTVVAW